MYLKRKINLIYSGNNEPVEKRSERVCNFKSSKEKRKIVHSNNLKQHKENYIRKHTHTSLGGNC